MIYLDNNATTFLDPRVREALLSFYGQPCGNPSSVHLFGQRARALLVASTNTLAAFFSCRPQEIVFTSGATEALNMCVRSVPKNCHIITSSLEHPAEKTW